MKQATITIIALLLAIGLQAQCDRDTTYYSSTYDWVLAMDKSYVAGQIETSPAPEAVSIPASAYPAVILRHINCSMKVISTTCGELSFSESELVIPGGHNYEAIDWRIYPDNETFEKAASEPMKSPTYHLRKTSLK